jgi:phenylalanine ammonia-lyase
MKTKPIILSGDRLTLEEVVSIARYHTKVQLTDDENVKCRMNISCEVIDEIVKKNLGLYGVTTPFGGLATSTVSGDYIDQLQSNIVVSHNMGAGSSLPLETVRAAMVLRANTHLIGASGIRRTWDERLILFLMNNVTPLVPEFGSIGASGDLVPLSYIASALAGNDDRVLVNFDGEIMSAPDALAKLNVKPLSFIPKEGLALMNGTSIMAASAALATHDFSILLAATLHVHALAIQALSGSNQPFHPFLHRIKPHPGQVSTVIFFCSSGYIKLGMPFKVKCVIYFIDRSVWLLLFLIFSMVRK